MSIEKLATMCPNSDWGVIVVWTCFSCAVLLFSYTAGGYKKAFPVLAMIGMSMAGT